MNEERILRITISKHSIKGRAIDADLIRTLMLDIGSCVHILGSTNTTLAGIALDFAICCGSNSNSFAL